ncbi:HIT domain-containing protein [Cognatilysobacter bugurensis]|uniref:HIT family protein n=1 Tax=Cognatilysobacter bugurensis TaxID=543356 RepID=A0A918STI4_9GAMM|nr:HIT family protein [Lysobacter bugurensis]GHA70917.1 HIT family protein [Lysobacter bugurensis]
MNGADAAWSLNPRLEADTHPVARWPLCDVRLMEDARYVWLILVPRIADAVEIVDLPADVQQQLTVEVARASAALRAVASPHKLNVGALGNVVRQLHVHVVARFEGDAAWPGPVWGHGTAEPYTAAARSARLQALRAACAAD